MAALARPAIALMVAASYPIWAITASAASSNSATRRSPRCCCGTLRCTALRRADEYEAILIFIIQENRGLVMGRRPSGGSARIPGVNEHHRGRLASNHTIRIANNTRRGAPQQP